VEVLSETLRLELQPFNVKVVIVITGAVKTNIFNNSPGYHLPEGSLYSKAGKEIEKCATVNPASPVLAEDYARSVVNDVLAGASGPLYHGSMATVVRFVMGYFPKFVLVSRRTQVSSCLEF